jgi:hypothetical protein
VPCHERLSPAQRAHRSQLIRDPGVPLRSTPGFMLTPASQAWDCASNGEFVKYINALSKGVFQHSSMTSSQN